MALPSFSDDRNYQVKDDGSQITLDLIFGSLGQSPNYDIDLDGNSLASGGTASIKDFIVGTDTVLVGMVLKVTGNIVDMPGTNDKLTLTYRVKGGVSTLQQDFSVTGTTGDHVDFFITIRFFK
jgi:hypothetical protein